MTTRFVVLPDDRTIEVLDEGPVDALAVVLHHGTPSSSGPSDVQRAILEQGLRHIGLNRPGYGGSSPQPSRRVADIAADTRTVLDHLGIAHCVVGGTSGGGPHALACAALVPQALSAFVVASVAPMDSAEFDWYGGMSPGNVAEFRSAEAGRASLIEALRDDAAMMSSATAEQFLADNAATIAGTDQSAMRRTIEEKLESARHALANGLDGWVDDALAFVAPWGFDVGDIAVPTSVWHGADDVAVPVAHGRWLAQHIPTAREHILTATGHASITESASDILAEAVQFASS